ncbi:hypothetical protein IEQ34_019242 [Dendrobium chrysotoxum]|uniref:Uncharacterized protein n=1 Tax=Dendrobium chrysotoxum TaxID=161865 RepID=A0AAV7G806_DENCH|nr:hypothetical protein IEQ34_019242 [Dendrobium chrysotoxum]
MLDCERRRRGTDRNGGGIRGNSQMRAERTEMKRERNEKINEGAGETGPCPSGFLVDNLLILKIGIWKSTFSRISPMFLSITLEVLSFLTTICLLAKGRDRERQTGRSMISSMSLRNNSFLSLMATYFHGAPEIHPDGLQTLYLMNPGYVGYADAAGAPAGNMVFLNSGGITSLNPINLSHSPPPNHQQQHFVGIPLPPPQENSAGRFHYNLWSPAAATNLMGRGTTQQGLSLSLSPQQPHPYGGYRAEAEVSAPIQEMTIAGDDGVRPMGQRGRREQLESKAC